jgi:hypothetical protein
MTNDASHPGRPEPRRGRHRRRAGPLAAALIGAGLLAAACGGPAGPGVANACAAAGHAMHRKRSLSCGNISSY